MIDPSNRYPVISEAEIDAHINESKRLQEEAIEAEHARKAHAEGERLEAEERAAQAAARNQEAAADDLAHLTQAADEMLADGRGEIPAIETWPERVYFQAGNFDVVESFDIYRPFDNMEDAHTTKPTWCASVEYIRTDLAEKMCGCRKLECA